MKRDDGKGGKFFLYNRNGSISLALGDMAASMTGLVKESMTVELDERNYAKEYANYHSKPEQIANRSSRNKARRIMAKENDVDGMDVGHADNNPMNNDPANLRIENPSDNRREPRMRNEGTWAIPDTPKKKRELKKLLSRPLKAKDASDKLYSLIGDDELADDVDDYAKKHPNEDVRTLVRSHMERMRIKEDVNEGKQAKYPLYHKDFSGAMKTAYDHAKKNLGVIVDPEDIDNKVAMGPKKPSTGKTNSYRLTDKSGKKAIQVQVYNTGKSYELNMYKEDLDEAVELDEASKTLQAMMKIVDQKQAAKIDGVMVDMFTASAVTQIYNKVNDANKAKLDKMKATQLANVAMKLMKKEDVQLDEAPRRKGAPKIKPDFLKVQRAKDAEHNAAMGRTKTGRKKPVRTMTSTQKSLASMRRECAGEVELDESKSLIKDYEKYMSQGGKKDHNAIDYLMSMPKYKRMSKDQMAKTIGDAKRKGIFREEVQHIQESFKAGGLKLKDGKQVMVKKDDATMLNDLMKQLSKPNVKKMTDTAMKNKKGYAEILGFARDSHE